MSRFFFALLGILLILTPLPSQRLRAASTLVRAVGTTLVDPDGRPFYVLGANYAGAPDRSWRMWEDEFFDPGLIEKDFLKAKQAGLNTLRIFIRQPLPAEVKAGRWEKLDRVVDIARRHRLLLLVTLYDYQQDDLQEVAAVGKLIAQRYAGEPTILGYDLHNEPHFSNLATAQYPPGVVPPLLTDALIKHFGERVTREAAEVWRQSPEGQNLTPRRFTPEQAYLLANNYRLYREFLDEGSRWVAAHSWEVSTLDYMDSPDSAAWRPLLSVLDDTLAAWLSPQVKAVRDGAPQHLLTVGYSDVVLARLGANRTLGFHSVHRYPGQELKPFRVALGVLANLRTHFPTQPQVLTEFGYANSATDPATSALYETGVILHLLAAGGAGAMKWVLNDLTVGSNTRENTLGMYAVDGSAKPVVAALAAVSEYLSAGLSPGTFSLGGAEEIRFVYDGTEVLVIGARVYQDERLTVRAQRPAVIFLTWNAGGELRVRASESAQIRLDVRSLVGGGELENRYELLRVSGDTPVAHPFEVDGTAVQFAVDPGLAYRLRFYRREAEARIEIVWPHGDRPVRDAAQANVTAYLFQRGTRQVICPPADVRLWRALNNGLEEEVAIGRRRLATEAGLRFPVWDFNDVDVDAARDPANRYYFRLSVDGLPSFSNVWSHGQDARTYFPQVDQPEGTGDRPPTAVDARIEIVWPHDNLPVSQAVRANLTAFLFEPGTHRTVAATWNPTVRLRRSLNQGTEESVSTGQKVMRRLGDLVFPAWDFNDVDVSAARDPANKYYFRVVVEGVPSRSNVWSHGADARTYFPQRDVPASGAACP